MNHQYRFVSQLRKFFIERVGIFDREIDISQGKLSRSCWQTRTVTIQDYDVINGGNRGQRLARHLKICWRSTINDGDDTTRARLAPAWRQISYRVRVKRGPNPLRLLLQL